FAGASFPPRVAASSRRTVLAHPTGTGGAGGVRRHDLLMVLADARFSVDLDERRVEAQRALAQTPHTPGAVLGDKPVAGGEIHVPQAERQARIARMLSPIPAAVRAGRHTPLFRLRALRPTRAPLG